MNSFNRNITLFTVVILLAFFVSCQKGNEPIPYMDGLNSTSQDNSNSRYGEANEGEGKGIAQSSEGGETGDEGGESGEVIGGDDNEDDDDTGNVIGGDDNEDDDDKGDKVEPNNPGSSGSGQGTGSPGGGQ